MGLKPIHVFDRLTGNGWWEEEATGTRYFYDRNGVQRKVVHGTPKPVPLAANVLSPSPGLSPQAQSMADEQAHVRKLEQQDQQLAHDAMTPKPVFDIREAVANRLMGVPGLGGGGTSGTSE